jgi:hypothetical protein
MPRITPDTTVEELAAIVSQALHAKGITATLSGGGAVSIYTRNEYQSEDLDFVTAASHKELRSVIEPLGFAASRNPRQFEHPATHWLIEFPPSPLGFGGLAVDARTLPVLQTAYGPIRIITPTLSILDRLAAYWYHKDSQCWDQAVMVARNQVVDWGAIYKWARNEGKKRSEIDRLRSAAGI